MKIGIPRSLLYYYYYPLWKTYFEELGIEVVSTPATSKKIIDMGIKHSVPELCVPIKIYIGHLLKLIEDGVDYIYVPRFVSILKGQYFCPKFMGLPDMIRHSFEGIEDKMIIPTIESKNENIAEYKNFKIFEEKLGISTKANKKAIAKARRVWESFKNYCHLGYSANEASDLALGKIIETGTLPAKASVTIGVVGYVYNLYDSYISMDIIKKLREMDVSVKTFEMIKEDVLNQKLQNMSKNLFWTFSDKLIAAGYTFYDDANIDGLIHVTAFGCGPDSMLGKLLELDSPVYEKPFMTIRVDEHSGENHLQTRIEAFVDMIKRKKIKARRGA
ncbi:acyl-CoA dehydratase activase-related protein [Alkaliphilus peptidifermentans]|uniref:Predicted nucleotide-binding protein, sugar kinase/HSP70/actin superfamily n=1 Tax=Alkaliphilus peptidifermentans DSM 18978 TaxID=1120976 RepID=A0A1G5HYJ7_9FIRM|nr:acyl-CoA dehydratase activase-related protein [Alkaliphilus peptidifermentans]SCY68876.1 Predicted nucleotide-binding protein, sugar kinase/HSP70/actin superfamily [Alkaliphilus peptidifermentans DSM 18978]